MRQALDVDHRFGEGGVLEAAMVARRQPLRSCRGWGGGPRRRTAIAAGRPRPEPRLPVPALKSAMLWSARAAGSAASEAAANLQPGARHRLEIIGGQLPRPAGAGPEMQPRRRTGREFAHGRWARSRACTNTGGRTLGRSAASRRRGRAIKPKAHRHPARQPKGGGDPRLAPHRAPDVWRPTGWRPSDGSADSWNGQGDRASDGRAAVRLRSARSGRAGAGRLPPCSWSGGRLAAAKKRNSAKAESRQIAARSSGLNSRQISAGR